MKSKILGLLAVGLLAGPMAAKASLLGDTIVVGRYANGATIGDGTCCGPFNVTVQAGSADTVALSTGNNSYFNPEAFSLNFSLGPESGSGGANVLSTHEIVVGGIDSFLTGISVTSDVPGFDSGWVSFTDHMVTINILNLSYSGGQFLNIGLRFNDGTTVPEPGTLALLGLGLAGLGLSRRRKA